MGAPTAVAPAPSSFVHSASSGGVFAAESPKKIPAASIALDRTGPGERWDRRIELRRSAIEVFVVYIVGERGLLYCSDWELFR